MMYYNTGKEKGRCGAALYGGADSLGQNRTSPPVTSKITELVRDIYEDGPRS